MPSAQIQPLTTTSTAGGDMSGIRSASTTTGSKQQSQQHIRTHSSSNEESTIAVDDTDERIILNKQQQQPPSLNTSSSSTGNSPSTTTTTTSSAPPSPPLATIDGRLVQIGAEDGPSSAGMSSVVSPPDTAPNRSNGNGTPVMPWQQQQQGHHSRKSAPTSSSSGGRSRHRGRSNSDIPPAAVVHGGGGGGVFYNNNMIIPPFYYSHHHLGSSAPGGVFHPNLAPPYPPATLQHLPYQPRHLPPPPPPSMAPSPPPSRRPHSSSMGSYVEQGGLLPPPPPPGASSMESTSLRGTGTMRQGSSRRSSGLPHPHVPRRHRKSKSSSAADPNYGSFWNNAPAASTEAPPPPPPPPSMNNKSSNSNKFSPRNELRKLTQGLSPRSYRRYNQSLNAHSWSGPPPSMSFLKTSSTPYASSSAAASVRRSHSAIGSISEASFYQQQHHQQSPSITLSSPGRLSVNRKQESSRKMHWRQQSVQLYMEHARGVEQELQCRNVVFLLLFVFHLLFIGYLGQVFSHEALQGNHYSNSNNMTSASTDDTTTGTSTTELLANDEVTIYYHNFIIMACLDGAFAITISAFLLAGMMHLARHFIQIALWVVITLSFVWGTVGIGVSPRTVVPVTGIIALGWAVAYSLIVWDRIPFAAANLLTALSALRDYPAMLVVAFLFQVLTLVYAVSFSIVVVGVYDEIQQHRRMELPPRMAYVIYGFLAVSFYWTYQVLRGAVQAITAGVVGGWWHRPGEKGLVGKVCFQTIFYSSGSICFGSLFVGPVRILRQLSSPFRPTSTQSSSLECLQECIFCIQSCVTSFIETVAAGCNSWAFTYIGMYHYGFLDAGYNATELFERRGWSTIVSDDLVPNVLFFTSLVIGGATGCFAHLISVMDELVVSPEGHGTLSFFQGVVLGLALTSILFSTVSAAVDAVLVCFATSPLDFEHNHKELSHEMRAAWREVWPGALDACDAVPMPPMAQGSPLSFHSSYRYGEGTPLL